MVRLIANLAKFTLKQGISVARFAGPPTVRLLLFATVASIQLSVIAVLSLFKGLPVVAEMIAKEWTHRAIEAGFPYLWEIQLRDFLFILAICTIFAGWTILFFITVFITVFTFNIVF